MLPDGMASAFSYIFSLSHKSSPDYNLVKLFFASTVEEEKEAFTSKIQIENQNAERNMLYDNKKRADVKKGEAINDMDNDFKFDESCDELQG